MVRYILHKFTKEIKVMLHVLRRAMPEHRLNWRNTNIYCRDLLGCGHTLKDKKVGLVCVGQGKPK